VVPWRPKGVLSNQPARREDNKVDNSTPGIITLTSEDSEYRRVGMVERDRPYGNKFVKVILVRSVISMPSHHIEGAVVLRVHPVGAVEAYKDIPGVRSIFIAGLGSKEISIISKPI
jgi:ribosomal protein L30/L7E